MSNLELFHCPAANHRDNWHLMPRRIQLSEENLSPRMGHILRELERIIVSEGFLHLDTVTLARRLRCSKRALYTLAPTQEQLLLLLIGRVLDRTNEYLARAARDAGDSRARLMRYMNAIVQASRPASARFLRDITNFAPGMRLLQQHQRRTFDRLEKVIRDGIEAGAFNDISPKLVAELILMAAGRLIDPAFQRKLGLNLPESYVELSRLLNHGLLPQQEFGSTKVKLGAEWNGTAPQKPARRRRPNAPDQSKTAS
jgi:AcrR family transcriptional regulator